MTQCLVRVRAPRAVLPLLLVAVGVLGLPAAPAAAQPSTYGLQFVSTAATGIAMNGMGDVIGTRSVDPGCFPCLGITQTVVWRDGVATELVGPPGLGKLALRAINNNGWIVGTGAPSFPGIDDHAVVWKPVGAGYQAIDLGVLPGTTRSTVAGIDDQNRVLGYSVTQFFPPSGSPFLWTESGGMVDLTTLGFPSEGPAAVSPGGAVALTNSWYHLDDPGSVTPLTAVPSGFFSPGAIVVINDEGVQGRFLTATSGENLVYPFRYHTDGTWQQVSTAGTGHLTTWGLGSINQAADLTATVLGSGVVAYGPDGSVEGLAGKLSAAYAGGAVTAGGSITESGEILAEVFAGNSPRLVRLEAIEPCVSNCAWVSTFLMQGQFVDDPDNPGSCTDQAKNRVQTRIKVVDENGAPVAGAVVTGHYLDDYWMDKTLTATTSSNGQARFRHVGIACVGAVAFLVTDVSAPGRTFDRTTGTLSGFVIPLP